MRIIVLVKQVPDTWGERTMDLAAGVVDRSGEGIIDEVGERALEAALSYKDRAKDAEVVVMTMGPSGARDILRKALAMGADSAVHVQDDELAGADLARTAQVLAAAIRQTGFDLVIAGNESTDGQGGVLPAMVAEHLDVAHATQLDSVVITPDDVRGVRSTEDGTADVRATLPAVCSVTERAPEPRFPNLRGVMKARKKPLRELSCADLAVPEPVAASVLTGVSERPARTAGIKIVDDGGAADQLVQYLAAAKLI